MSNQAYQEALEEITSQLYSIRCERGLTISQLQRNIKYPVQRIEKMEMGIRQAKLADVIFLARLYKKKIKIELVDV